jgi:hypothetical protein
MSVSSLPLLIFLVTMMSVSGFELVHHGYHAIGVTLCCTFLYLPLYSFWDIEFLANLSFQLGLSHRHIFDFPEASSSVV